MRFPSLNAFLATRASVKHQHALACARTAQGRSTKATSDNQQDGILAVIGMCANSSWMPLAEATIKNPKKSLTAG